MLIVLIILVIVFTITFSAARKTERQNQINSCAFKLKAIGQALRLYRQDEGDVPTWPPPSLAGAVDYVNDRPNAPFDPTRDFRPGLWSLVDLGYTTNENIFTCPNNPYADDRELANWITTSGFSRWADLFERLHGYEWIDGIVPEYPTPGEGVATGEWLYQPDRTDSPGNWPTTTANSVYYLRQMGHQRDNATNAVTFSIRYPADKTVVVWCQYHRQVYTRNRIGQDNVLYPDGHVEMRNAPRTVTASEMRAMLEPREP
jgi:type II secretory pathway pseudopilin PulG